MAFTIRPLHTDEQKYTYRQSTQIEGQTGSIGYLRGDFGAGGKEFFSSWFDHRRDLKTDEFKSELDEVINALRSEEYGLLKSRTAMAQYAGKYPDSAFQGNYATEYGFRADTEKYSFLIRCNPARGDDDGFYQVHYASVTLVSDDCVAISAPAWRPFTLKSADTTSC